MAAPTKRGLDYFPHAVGMMRDQKLRKVKQKYGYLAVVIYLIILEMAYGDNGYYLDYSDPSSVAWEIGEYLQGKYQPTEETVLAVVDDLVACGLFSRDHYQTMILTSRRMQRTYYCATTERKAVDVDPCIWMLSLKEMQDLSMRSSILRLFHSRADNGITRADNGSARAIKKQSKVKESKRKESSSSADAQETTTSDQSAYPLLEYLQERLPGIAQEGSALVMNKLNQMAPEVIRYAIDETAAAPRPSLRYLAAILRDLEGEGIATADSLANRSKHAVADSEPGLHFGHERGITDEHDSFHDWDLPV